MITFLAALFGFSLANLIGGLLQLRALKNCSHNCHTLDQIKGLVEAKAAKPKAEIYRLNGSKPLKVAGSNLGR